MMCRCGLVSSNRCTTLILRWGMLIMREAMPSRDGACGKSLYLSEPKTALNSKIYLKAQLGDDFDS